jgi:MurNAc alpha-1-phosphate uridylyltransferase
MILAAGRGERLRPLTDNIPKPLLEVAGQALIFHHLDALSAAGFREVVINLAHLGDQLREAVGHGGKWGLNIHYSPEPAGALETGGGIARALDLLGSSPFLVVNGDIYCDYPFGRLRAVKCDYAHLVLVPVPHWREGGDFALQRGRIQNRGESQYTFSGISVYHPRFFEACEPGRWSVVPLLRNTIDSQLVTGEVHQGVWHDAGTISRLEQLQAVAGQNCV